ncbi:hypothetical protein DSC45_06150 [Streptomyces sp. YIM 130001]|uniref:hypothetical protein n=1 Tax=Streptomyces sp. YIM 130001 TaxID=2259644 RepID=UPI000E65D98E|nr:hypothetical protein [Streptomyces sp. YIM 130001]RII19576.1 hypothetical protein DSC45_06150 [Streptomyces sp. YIM 130001]
MISDVSVESFVRVPGGEYVSSGDMDRPPGDPDYVEGYIRIVMGGREVMGAEDWDLVDQLWAYIARMLHEVVDSGEAFTLFPDQPLELAFRREGSRLMIRCGEKKAEAELTSTVSTLKEAALRFFRDLDRVQQAESWRNADVRDQWEALAAPTAHGRA